MTRRRRVRASFELGPCRGVGADHGENGHGRCLCAVRHGPIVGCGPREVVVSPTLWEVAREQAMAPALTAGPMVSSWPGAAVVTVYVSVRGVQYGF